MQNLSLVFEEIKEKLSQRQRAVLAYAGKFDNSYQRSLEVVAQLFGTNKEFILEILKSAYLKFPKEVSIILGFIQE